jgi:ribosomal protein L11 methyltransferase
MDVEVLTELLMENGALSCVVEDADYGTERERPIFDEPDQAQSESWLRVPSEATGDNFWANCNVTAYFAKDFDIPAVVNMVSEAMALPVIPRYSIDLMADRDWVKEVQRGWTPILIDDLVLRFPWHSTGDVAAYLESQGVTEEPHYEVTLEGGMAFGTGEHATTRLCCRWLRRQISKGNSDRLRVMDYGAGSGVLGLAALVYGAAEAAGVEIDPDSIAAAHANAAINNLPAFKCYLPAPSAGAGGGQRSSAAADVALAQQIRDPAGVGRTRSSAQANPKFTFLTSTNVQILTLTRLPGAARGSAQLRCCCVEYSGRPACAARARNSSPLPPRWPHRALRYSVYLLY